MPSDISPPVKDAGTECVDGFCPMPTHTPKPNGRAKSLDDLDPFVVWKVRANDDLDLLLKVKPVPVVIDYCNCQAILLLSRVGNSSIKEINQAHWYLERAQELLQSSTDMFPPV